MKSWPASKFYKGKKCYGTGYEMMDEIDRLKAIIAQEQAMQDLSDAGQEWDADQQGET